MAKYSNICVIPEGYLQSSRKTYFVPEYLSHVTAHKTHYRRGNYHASHFERCPISKSQPPAI